MSAVALRLAEPTRRLRGLVLILPGFPARAPEDFGDLAAMAERIARLADGAEVSLRMGYAAYPGLEPFAAITASAAGRQLCMVGGPWATEAEHARACLDLTRALS